MSTPIVETVREVFSSNRSIHEHVQFWCNIVSGPSWTNNSSRDNATREVLLLIDQVLKESDHKET